MLPQQACFHRIRSCDVDLGVSASPTEPAGLLDYSSLNYLYIAKIDCEWSQICDHSRKAVKTLLVSVLW